MAARKPASRIEAQVKKDAALLAVGGTSHEIVSLTWHFFPNSRGSVGLSDKLRELLELNEIPYVIHTP